MVIYSTDMKLMQTPQVAALSWGFAKMILQDTSTSFAKNDPTTTMTAPLSYQVASVDAFNGIPVPQYPFMEGGAGPLWLSNDMLDEHGQVDLCQHWMQRLFYDPSEDEDQLLLDATQVENKKSRNVTSMDDDELSFDLDLDDILNDDDQISMCTPVPLTASPAPNDSMMPGNVVSPMSMHDDVLSIGTAVLSIDGVAPHDDMLSLGSFEVADMDDGQHVSRNKRARDDAEPLVLHANVNVVNANGDATGGADKADDDDSSCVIVEGPVTKKRRVAPTSSEPHEASYSALDDDDISVLTCDYDGLAMPQVTKVASVVPNAVDVYRDLQDENEPDAVLVSSATVTAKPAVAAAAATTTDACNGMLAMDNGSIVTDWCANDDYGAAGGEDDTLPALDDDVISVLLQMSIGSGITDNDEVDDALLEWAKSVYPYGVVYPDPVYVSMLT